jgi:membrane associated rhomboid family serine protease
MINQFKKLNLSKETKAILLINIAVYIVTFFIQIYNPRLVELMFVAHPMNDPNFYPFQIITHMFMHGGIIHLIFNMLGLIYISDVVEKKFKTSKFLLIYFGAGVISYFVQSSFFGGGMVGASGCIYGTFGAFIVLFPYELMGIMFLPFQFEAKKLFFGLIAIETFLGLLQLFTPYNDGIGHFAHISGGLFGYAIASYYKQPTFVKGKIR